MKVLLGFCFTLSGAAALAAELLWLRSAGLVLGQTATTTAIVLACYFGGLGLGSAGARRFRSRPVRAYALLEFGAAAGVAWSAVWFQFLLGDSALTWLGRAGPVGHVLAVAAGVLPATVCFGATLPTLGQAVSGPARVDARVCLFYALNTLGGAAGILAAGFWLPAAIGVHASYGVAVAASACAGLMALTIASGRAADPTAGIAALAAAPDRRRAMLLVAASTGALGLCLEVLWTRLFAQVLHNSVYSFSAIALVFLLAISAGAGSAALLLRRFAPLPLASLALLGAGGLTILGTFVFWARTDGLDYFGMQAGLGEYVGRILVLASLTAGPAALVGSMVLPALWVAAGGRRGVARSLGDLSSASALGGIGGALAAAWLGIPLLGVRGSLLAAAVAFVVLADVLAPGKSRLRPVGYAVLLAVVIADPLREPLVHLRRDAETLRSVAEGPAGVVTVVESTDDLQLRLDNNYVLGGVAAATNERRLGLVPLLLHPQPRRAMFVGMATGITASAAPALGVEATTVAELVPEVVHAARTSFAAWNGHLLEQKDVTAVIDDGRHYLASHGERYDVIVADLFVPWHAGAGSLYSREMYELVASRLADHGLFCQWLPLYQLTRQEFDVIAHTFLGVFPHVGLWRADFYPNRPVCGLVGSLAQPVLDLDRVRERAASLPGWARDPQLVSPRGLVMLYAGDLAAAADWFAGAPVNSDGRPWLEFTAPRMTRMSAAGDKDWFTGPRLADFYRHLDERLSTSADALLPAASEIHDARRAGTALFEWSVAAANGDQQATAQLEAEVRALVPEVVLAADPPGNADAKTRAERELVILRSEQESMKRSLMTMQRRLDELAHGQQK